MDEYVTNRSPTGTVPFGWRLASFLLKVGGTLQSRGYTVFHPLYFMIYTNAAYIKDSTSQHKCDQYVYTLFIYALFIFYASISHKMDK